MNVQPVISRELRAEARHPFNHWLRVIGGAVALTVFVMGYVNRPEPSGAKVFGTMHTILLISIWLLVPFITADCIARERREGTLGLLFLTPLTPIAIVIGKCLVHMTRALTFWLAAVPVIVIPLLLGGVSWLDIYTAVGFQLCSLLLALAAGLIASSLGTNWGRTLLLAQFIGALFAGFFAAILVATFLANMRHVLPSNAGEISNVFFWFPAALILASGGGDQGWGNILRFLPKAGTAIQIWPWFVIEVAGCSLLLFWFAIRISTRLVAKNWGLEPPSARKLWWLQVFCTPQFWRSIFRGKMRRALDRNPIGWLHQYSWSARLIKWGWCLGMVITETVLIATCDWEDLPIAQLYIGFALLVAMSLTAVASFRRERETGALELLLVTPLTEKNIIWGRVRGIYSQFAFAIGVLIVASLALDVCSYQPWYRRDELMGLWIAYCVGALGFLILPVFGLYFSLQTKHFLVGWLLTWVFATVMPLLIFIVAVFPVSLILFHVSVQAGVLSVIGTFAAATFVAVLIIYWRLVDALVQRRFVVRI